MRLRAFALFGLAILIALTAFPGLAQAATFTVTKTADTFDAVCDDDCSLREAIAVASPSDNIDVPAGTYTLTLGAQITIDKGLTLTGAGADLTIIEAATEPGVADYRVFTIDANEAVIISGVTIRHGNTNLQGGGIFMSSGMLTLINSTISDNSANSNGGGIFNNGITLTIENSHITDNKSSGNSGGGIYNSTNGTLTITDSTIVANRSLNNVGGGIHNVNGTVDLTNSTVSNNSAVNGGGVNNSNNGVLNLISSTIINNSASSNGGGIFVDSGTVEAINTIIAQNTAPIGPDCRNSVTSLGHNLIGFLAGCGFTTGPGDLTGTPDIPLDPRLGPLQDNGGPTLTHALLEDSPAVNHGDNTVCPDTDQRGIPRIQGAACDIGAFEVESSANLPPVAENDCYSVHQDITLDTELDGLPGVLDNDKDPEDDDLMAIPVGTVSHGELALNPSGEFTYAPEPGFSGEASFIYFAYDGLLASNEVTVTITVVPLCTLDIELSYTDGTLTMDFELATLEPATWDLWLVVPGTDVFPVWSLSLPVVDPSVPTSLSFPFPSIGTIGFLTALLTSEGITCSDWAVVDTGAPSSVPSAGEIRELFRGANKVLSNEQ